MSKEIQTNNGGVGFVGALTIAFIVLKLTDCIDWSWWWVLSPAWIVLGLLLLIVAVCGAVILVKK